MFPHLGTQPQPLIRRLDVICYYEEHLLTLQIRLDPDSEIQGDKRLNKLASSDVQ